MDFMKGFNAVVTFTFQVLLGLIALSLLLGVGGLVLDLWRLALSGVAGAEFLEVISNILTLFVLIELSRSLVEYFNSNRLRLTFIVDASLVFVLREVMIKLFQNRLSVAEIYALSALLLILGGLRVSAIVMYQRERQILDPPLTRKLRDGCPVLGGGGQCQPKPSESSS